MRNEIALFVMVVANQRKQSAVYLFLLENHQKETTISIVS